MGRSNTSGEREREIERDLSVRISNSNYLILIIQKGEAEK